MKSQVLAVALLGAVLSAGPVRAAVVTIDFEAIALAPPFGTTLTPITNQFAPNVLFSSNSPGEEIIVTTQTAFNDPTAGVPNNLICTATGSGPMLGVGLDCTHNVVLNFPSPVSDLSFDAFGNDSTLPGQQFAQADVYQNGVLTQPNIPLDTSAGGNDGGLSADHQTLAFSNITEVIIHNNTDSQGTAYDNFSFVTTEATTPEPSTLILTGLCGIVWAGRRFLARKSI